MKSFKRKAGRQFFSSSHPSSHLSHYLWLLLSSSCCQKIIRPLPHDWSTSKQSPWHIFMEHHYTVPSTIDVCSTASIFHPTIIPPSHAELQGKFCFWPKSTIARFHCQQGFQGGHPKLQKRIRHKRLSIYPSTDTVDRFLHNLIVNFIDFDSMNGSSRLKLWGYLIGITYCIHYTICQRRSFWWHTLYNITAYELCAFGFCAFLG